MSEWQAIQEACESLMDTSGRKSKTDDPGRIIKAISDTEIRLTFHLLAKEGLVGETYRGGGFSVADTIRCRLHCLF